MPTDSCTAASFFACSTSSWPTWSIVESTGGGAHVTLEAAMGNGHRPQSGRARLKAWTRRLPFRPLLRFLYLYVWQCGFLDGREGYYFARLHALYEFLSVTKTFELRKRRNGQV